MVVRNHDARTTLLTVFCALTSQDSAHDHMNISHSAYEASRLTQHSASGVTGSQGVRAQRSADSSHSAVSTQDARRTTGAAHPPAQPAHSIQARKVGVGTHAWPSQPRK